MLQEVQAISGLPCGPVADVGLDVGCGEEEGTAEDEEGMNAAEQADFFGLTNE